MSIKLTNKQAAASKPMLDYLANMVALPPRPGFQIGHAQRLLAPAFAAYEEQRIKLVNQFAKKDGEGRLIEEKHEGQVAQAVIEDRPGFEAAIAELQAAEIELAVSTITVESLGETALLPSVFGVLDWLIVA